MATRFSDSWFLRFRLERGFGWNPSHLKLWPGDPRFIKDFGEDKSIQAIGKHFSLDQLSCERIYRSVTGKLGPLGFQDFEQVAKYNFIYPEDTHKKAAWFGVGYDDVRKTSAGWMLNRLRGRKPDDARVCEVVEIIQESYDRLVEVPASGYADDIRDAVSDIDRFYFLCSTQNTEFKINSFKLEALVFLGSLVYEPDRFQAIFSPIYKRKLRRVKTTYERQENPMKRYSRQNLSDIMSGCVNIALEFDLVPNALDIFDNQDPQWPLLYRGVSSFTSPVGVAYELLRRVALGHPISLDILQKGLKTPERAQSYSYSERETSALRRRLGYPPGKMMKELTALLTENSILETLEAESLLRGPKPIYRDMRDNYHMIYPEQMAFFCALVQLGLKPYKLTREESHSVYGYAEKNTGYGIEGTDWVIRYMTRGTCVNHKKELQQVLLRCIQNKARVLNVLWDIHLNRTKVLAAQELRKALKRLAKMGIESAQEIMRLVD